MHDAHELLKTLAIVLCLAALTTIVFQRLKQPVVFGYLLAGMIAGPHIPIPLVADEPTVRTLSELGVILLMFSLGLEFSLRTMVRIIPRSGLVALFQAAVMMSLGFSLAQLFGWSRLESLYAGAAISISSTTIIAKVFEEQRVRGRFTGLVLGVLITEDLIAIVLVATLTALSAGGQVTATSLGVTAVRLVAFLVVLIVVGLLIVPRLTRAVVKLNRPETTLIVALGVCFGASLLALSFGYSVALGAFIAGSLIAESGEEKKVEKLVQPVRDMFAAIFFVSVGMLFDPVAALRLWPAVLAFTTIVIVGNIGAVTIGSFLTGHGVRTSVQAGVSLAQIGEFSFIIAAVGVESGATSDVVYQMAIAVSAITTLTTPILVRNATGLAAWIDRVLPHPVQMFASLYGSWIERVRRAPTDATRRTRLRHLVELLLLDAAAIAGVIIATGLEMPRFIRLMRGWTGAPDTVARLIVLSGAFAIGVPLLLGLVRVSRLLGSELARRAMPEVAAGKVDTAAAPRGTLVVALQLAIVSAVTVPLLALTHPFVPSSRTGVVAVFVLAVLAVAFWRSATNLQGHAVAGAEVIMGALGRQMSSRPSPSEEMRLTLEHVNTVVPGLGEPVPLTIEANSPVAGKSLAAIDLRGLTGATVLAIVRDGEPIAAPGGRVKLREGDVLAVAGSRDAVEAAREIVAPPPKDSSST
jgi:CPA2 family monovalent cation:H+ antiporter-2